MILRFADYPARGAVHHADVVVIGTGAGGGVAGTELAEAGLEVVFVEEGSHHATESFNPYATETVPRLYRDASSTVLLGTPDIPYLEGRCVGGSTTINGGMTYRTPEPILAEWERSTGSAELGPAGMERLFQRVEERIVSRHQLDVSVGDGSRILVEGARRKGWKVEINRRNQEACVGSNNCVFGCPTGAKQSTLVSYIPRALAAGARLLTEVKVESLIIERGRCVGVRGRAVNPRTRRLERRLEVRARAVIVACGAVQTPNLLLRHGLGRASGLLGENLLCHPNVKVLGVYPFDVNAWQGVNQYGQIREFHDEGILMAENMVPPGAMAALIPRIGSGAWELMRDFNRICATGVLVEDSGAGRVRAGPFGMAVPSYTITALDHRRFLRGARYLAELHFEMGAKEVILPFAGFSHARSADELRAIDETRIPAASLELLTVHIMGTCALGSRPQASVVDLSGQCWELPGCYVADASLFPTAIGVNPQVTIMALATRVAERLGERLHAERAREARHASA